MPDRLILLPPQNTVFHSWRPTILLLVSSWLWFAGCTRKMPEPINKTAWPSTSPTPISGQSEQQMHLLTLPPIEPSKIVIWNSRLKHGIGADYPKRARDFAIFADLIASRVRDDGLRISSFELLLLAGPPHGYFIAPTGEVIYLYLYTENKENDQALFLTIDTKGFVEGKIGWNRSDANNPDQFQSPFRMKLPR